MTVAAVTVYVIIDVLSVTIAGSDRIFPIFRRDNNTLAHGKTLERTSLVRPPLPARIDRTFLRSKFPTVLVLGASTPLTASRQKHPCRKVQIKSCRSKPILFGAVMESSACGDVLCSHDRYCSETYLTLLASLGLPRCGRMEPKHESYVRGITCSAAYYYYCYQHHYYDHHHHRRYLNRVDTTGTWGVLWGFWVWSY